MRLFYRFSFIKNYLLKWVSQQIIYQKGWFLSHRMHKTLVKHALTRGVMCHLIRWFLGTGGATLHNSAHEVPTWLMLPISFRCCRTRGTMLPCFAFHKVWQCDLSVFSQGGAVEEAPSGNTLPIFPKVWWCGLLILWRKL